MTLTRNKYIKDVIGPARREFIDLFPEKFELATNKYACLLTNTLAREYFVNFANALTGNLLSRLLRHLVSKYDLHGVHAAATLLNDAFTATARTAQLDSLRSWLKVDPRHPLNIKRNMAHFTRIQFEILNAMEALPNIAKHKRLFSLAPVANGYCATSVRLDPSAIKNIMQQLPNEDRRAMLKAIFLQATGISFQAYEQGGSSAKDKVAVTAAEIKLLVECIHHPSVVIRPKLFSNEPLRAALFGVLFKYEKLARRKYPFAYSATSNGVTASLLFARVQPVGEEAGGKENGANGKEEGSVEEEAVEESDWEEEIDDASCAGEIDKEKARREEEAKKHYNHVIGIDPGRINVGVAALQQGEGKPEIRPVSSKHYQHRAGHKVDKKRYEQNKKESPLFREVCEKSPSMKTANLDKMADAVEFRFKHFQPMYKFCIEQKFLKCQFTTWIRTRRAQTWIAKTFVGEEQLLDPFTHTHTRAEKQAASRTARMRKEQAQSHPQHQRHSNPKRKARRKKRRKERREEKRAGKRKKNEERGNTLVGIGDFSLKDNTRSIIRGHQFTPNQGIRKALLQRPGVVVWDIDESYTSKRCYKCQSVDGEMHEAVLRKRLKEKDLDKLEKEHKEVPKEEAVPCYKVLRCSKCQIPVQRDVNASLNILRLTRYKLEGRARPEYLSRIAPFRDNGETTGKPDQEE